MTLHQVARTSQASSSCPMRNMRNINGHFMPRLFAVKPWGNGPANHRAAALSYKYVCEGVCMGSRVILGYNLKSSFSLIIFLSKIILFRPIFNHNNLNEWIYSLSTNCKEWTKTNHWQYNKVLQYVCWLLYDSSQRAWRWSSYCRLVVLIGFSHTHNENLHRELLTNPKHRNTGA